MSGTKEGGQKGAKTKIERYGKDFYKNIGKKGGKNGHTGGFYANRDLARIAGAKGGKISRRGPAKKTQKKVTKKTTKPVNMVREIREQEGTVFKLREVKTREKRGLLSRLFRRNNG